MLEFLIINLANLNIDENYYNSTKGITRYELVRLLNLVDCFDCIIPDLERKNKLNYNWFEEFKKLPFSNFDDIYENDKYYYCVAYAANKGYVRGYSRLVSPICPGQFCGYNYASIADLVQIISNIISNNIYSKYKVNREDVKKWQETGIGTKSLTINEISAINKAFKKCKVNCEIKNKDEFLGYLKFCTHNLKKCGFKEIGNLKEGNWPIAEANILIKEGILKEEQLKNLNFYNVLSKKLAFEIFLKTKEKNNCVIDYDYDNDGFLNYKDLNPYYYNPDQKNIKEMVYLKAKADKINAYVNEIINFHVEKEGDFIEYIWNLGDGTQKKGEYIKHIYKKGGIYNIRVYGKTRNGNTYQASITISINESNNLNPISSYLEISCNPLISKAPTNISCTAKSSGGDSIQRNVPHLGISKTLKPNETFSFYVTNPASFKVNASLLKNNQSIASSNNNISILSTNNSNISISSQLNSSNLTPIVNQSFNLYTSYQGFSPSDVNYVLRNMGNGFSFTSSSLNTSFSYDKPGSYIINQTIFLKNGSSLNNSLSISVSNLINNKGAYIESNKTIASVLEEVTYTLNLKNINYEKIKKIEWLIDDGTKIINKELTLKHNFVNQGAYKVKTIIYEDDIYETSLIQGVKDNKKCNNYKCDLDKDGIADICDEDIDGDGFINLIGILIRENENCKITNDIINKNLLDLQINLIKKDYEKGKIKSMYDNCIYLKNDQIDMNQNGIGDECEEKENENKIEKGNLIINSKNTLAPTNKKPNISQTENYFLR